MKKKKLAKYIIQYTTPVFRKAAVVWSHRGATTKQISTWVKKKNRSLAKMKVLARNYNEKLEVIKAEVIETSTSKVIMSYQQDIFGSLLG